MDRKGIVLKDKMKKGFSQDICKKKINLRIIGLLWEAQFESLPATDFTASQNS